MMTVTVAMSTMNKPISNVVPAPSRVVPLASSCFITSETFAMLAKQTAMPTTPSTRVLIPALMPPIARPSTSAPEQHNAQT